MGQLAGSWPFTTDAVLIFRGHRGGSICGDALDPAMLSNWTVGEGPTSLWDSIRSANDSGGGAQRDTECMGAHPRERLTSPPPQDFLAPLARHQNLAAYFSTLPPGRHLGRHRQDSECVVAHVAEPPSHSF